MDTRKQSDKLALANLPWLVCNNAPQRHKINIDCLIFYKTPEAHYLPSNILRGSWDSQNQQFLDRDGTPFHEEATPVFYLPINDLACEALEKKATEELGIEFNRVA